MQEVSQFRLAVASFALHLGATATTTSQAVVTDETFNVAVEGDADLARALQVARALGIDTPKVSAKGAAKLNLQIAGHWTGFEAPDLSGIVQLKNVQADIPGLIETVQVNGATATIDAKKMTIQNVVAGFAKGPNATGTVSVPRNCAPSACAITFSAHADELSPERLNQLLNPKLRSRPWYNFFMPHPADQANPLLTLEASGQVTIDRWKMADTTASHLNAEVNIAAKHVKVSNLRADLLGGLHTGEWQADFTPDRPIFSGKGKLAHANLAQLAASMQQPWGTGMADLSYELKLVGMTPSDLQISASGIGEFSLHDGTLRHLSLDSKSGPLRVTKFEGTLALRDGNFVISEAKLQSGSAVYNVQGMATWTRQLNFKLSDNQHVFALSGTLDRPELKPGPATEALLKR
jgi:hypothetical protein